MSIKIQGVKKLLAHIKVLNLTISEQRSIAKQRNINGYKIHLNLFAKSQRSQKPIPLPSSLVPLPRPLVSFPRYQNSKLFKSKIEDNVIKESIIIDGRNLFRQKIIEDKSLKM